VSDGLDLSAFVDANNNHRCHQQNNSNGDDDDGDGPHHHTAAAAASASVVDRRKENSCGQSHVYDLIAVVRCQSASANALHYSGMLSVLWAYILHGGNSQGWFRNFLKGRKYPRRVPRTKPR